MLKHRLGNWVRRGRTARPAIGEVVGSEVAPPPDLVELEHSARQAHEAAIGAQERVSRLAETVTALNNQAEDLAGVCDAVQRALDVLVEERLATSAEAERFQAELTRARNRGTELLSLALNIRLAADDLRLRCVGPNSPQDSRAHARSALPAPMPRPLADATTSR